ncbi:MAG: helix-turn-helix transcriptional regulator [Rhodospirillaceae bacterium]|nr:helix-turn-helix transcriptional regulator [Rhodospirillaceae bacterium]
MLTGKALGQAIKSALDKATMSQADVAREFKVKPPSVSGWITTGRISKPNFEKLRQLLSEVVGPEHWGLASTRADRADEDRGNEYKILSDDEWWLVLAYRKGDRNIRTGMLSLARTVLPDRPAGLTKRTGT